jgi:hypothetical protein
MADDETTKGSGDFVRLYVIVMGVLALVLAVILVRSHNEKQDFERANAVAKAQFGAADAPATPDDQRPTTITGFAVGVSKYLATYREATVKAADTGPAIPVQTIKDRAGLLSLQIQTIGGEQTNRNNAKRYEEISSTITFDATDLDRLVKFMFNIEASGPRIRVLDLRWELRPDKENPYEPGTPGKMGNAIQRPQVKIGFRRPIAGTTPRP